MKTVKLDNESIANSQKIKGTAKINLKTKAEEYRAKNILQIVKLHKEDCHRYDCGVNIYLLKEDFERHMGRKATDKELSVFF